MIVNIETSCFSKKKIKPFGKNCLLMKVTCNYGIEKLNFCDR